MSEDGASLPERVERLRRFVQRSKRTSGVQFPPEFLRDDAGGNPPLAQMIRGGQGGEVRLKLYLTMTLLAVRVPHDITGKPARAWAELLDLPDPSGRGARRIVDALDWLEAAKLVKLERRPGQPSNITLLSPAGDGRRYRWRGGRYVRLPLGFWRQDWINVLSGTAVALLLVVLDMQGGKSANGAPWLTGPQRKRYGLSDDTWTRARKELESSGLLTVCRIPQGKEFDFRRLRNTYWVDVDLLDKGLGDN